MTYTLTLTSMALDHGTLVALDELSRLWGVSKAEVMRRAVRQLKDASDREAALPSPLKALDWLQNGGGLSRSRAVPP